MATMPDNMFPGAKIKMLMGPYPTKAECEQRQLISMAIFDAIGTTADWTECKSTERKRSN